MNYAVRIKSKKEKMKPINEHNNKCFQYVAENI